MTSPPDPNLVQRRDRATEAFEAARAKVADYGCRIQTANELARKALDAGDKEAAEQHIEQSRALDAPYAEAQREFDAATKELRAALTAMSNAIPFAVRQEVFDAAVTEATRRAGAMPAAPHDPKKPH